MLCSALRSTCLWCLGLVAHRAIVALPWPSLFHDWCALFCHRTDKVVLASSGMQADMMTLHKTLRMRLVKYQQNHQKDMSLTAASQMLSNMLYTRRFFPYYTFNVLGGIDEKGTLGPLC